MSSSRWLAVIASCRDPRARRCRLRWRRRQRDSSGAIRSAAEVSGEIAGAGATSQQAAQEAWIAEFENANSGATISYDPVGSGGGREQFISGGVAYAGTDTPLSEDEGELGKAIKRCEPGELIEVPDYISPIAIIYNLPEVEELKLYPETLAKIFNQEIDNWNDPAIAKRQPRRRTARHPDHPGQPLRRVGHDGKLHRLPLEGRSQRLEARTERRMAGERRRGRERHFRRRRSCRRRRRRDRLRRREPGRRTRHRQNQSRQRIRRTVG